LTSTLGGTGAPDFQINTCKGSIPPASTCVVSGQYLPVDSTGITGTITITDGSTNVSIAMVGVAIAAPPVDGGY
jgi:hypothetical protein